MKGKIVPFTKKKTKEIGKVYKTEKVIDWEVVMGAVALIVILVIVF